MLELKIRVRDPLLAKQVEEVKEKWLVIDSFDRVTTHVSIQAPWRSSDESNVLHMHLVPR